MKNETTTMDMLDVGWMDGWMSERKVLENEK
jgi:hypothetical protein